MCSVKRLVIYPLDILEVEALPLWGTSGEMPMLKAYLNATCAPIGESYISALMLLPLDILDAPSQYEGLENNWCNRHLGAHLTYE